MHFVILFKSVTDEVNNCLEKFVSALYGYKNETSVNNVRVKLLQMKGIRDLALLPLCKANPKFHISRANYVLIRLRMCLHDTMYYR